MATNPVKTSTKGGLFAPDRTLTGLDTPLGVAVLGAGYFARFHLEAWSRIAQADVIGVADTDSGKLADLGLPTYSSLVAMLGHGLPDILDIATPPATHAAAITAAIAAGVKTVICQKPFCTSLDEARRITRQARLGGVTLIIHENFRFQPWYRAMRLAIEDGLTGPVQNLTFRLRTGDGQGPQAYMARQPYFQTMERFLVHETAVHWIDTFCYLMGAPTAVYADLRRMNGAIAGEDAGHILFDYPNGARALFDGNRLLDHQAENHRLTFGEALLEGPRGSVTLQGNGEVCYRAFGETDTRRLLLAQDYAGFAGDCVFAFQQHVVDALILGHPVETAAETYLKVMELEEAVYASNETGRKQIIAG